MTVFTWDPKTYLKFGDQRTRPAHDLLARVALEAPKVIYDLGCGPGNSTRLLRERWPEADITGVDLSESMLDQARATKMDVAWEQADLATWRPAKTPDLIFSNATLHWLDGHGELFARLFGAIADGGMFAVQMPRNFTAASHTIIHQVVEQGPWAGKLRGVRDINPVDHPEDYYEYLSAFSDAIDIWETEYTHILEGDNPVFEWLKGSARAPYLELLPDKMCADFRKECKDKFALVYRRREDGSTLFPFRRLFMVAQRTK